MYFLFKILLIDMQREVFPVPPIYILPTHIVFKEYFFLDEFFFYQINYKSNYCERKKNKSNNIFFTPIYWFIYLHLNIFFYFRKIFVKYFDTNII